MKTYIKGRMMETHVSAETVSKRIGANLSSFYRSVKSDMRISRLFAISQAMGLQLGMFNPVTKKFKAIELEDIEEEKR